MQRLRFEIGLLLRAARSHPALTVLYAAALTLVGVAGLLIGLPLPVFALGLIVAAATWIIIRRRFGRERSTGRGAAILIPAAIGAVLLLAIQIVPYGRAHSNPPVTGEPQWATPETRVLMERACYQCHSNLVEYPWYASVAPMSWAVQSHVDGGRDEVNYSEFLTDPGNADESIEEILDGSMPPAYFTRFGLNPEAKLTEEEKALLVEGLRATPGFAPRAEGDD